MPRGRPKLYTTQAERQAAYVERNNIDDAARKRRERASYSVKQKTRSLERLVEWKEANPDHKRDWRKDEQYRKQKRREKRMSTPFIAFDGEGINTNEIQTYLRTNDDNNGMPVYRQNYVILTASDGRYIENWENGLKTEDCLDFLLSYHGENYLIGFGIGYDITKILHTEMNEKEIRKLWKNKTIEWRGYRIFYAPNKIFRVHKDGRHITLYDTRAFFQKSFVKALEDWKIDCPQEIKDGKKARSTFAVKDRREIQQYNLLECKLLVELLNKMRTAMHTVGVVPYRWYGVGALSQVVMEDNYIKQHLETPKAMLPHFLAAYYGGRNQVLKLGEFDKDVYIHDINSAYPHAMTELPSSIGTWSKCKPKYYDYPYTLYQVEWDLPRNTLITPFPVRQKGNIYYPLKGAGMYWQPEVQAAMRHYAKYIKITKCWFFEPNEPDVRLFGFYKDYYAQRQQFIKEGNDAQHVLKLTLNGGYGKLAQSVGGRIQIDPLTGEVTYNLPAFQNYFLAGMITSKCRAKVFELAMLSPRDVIAFATDGVAVTKQLVEHSNEKELGAWEVKRVQNYFIAQTGVYTYRDGDVEKFKSRGFGYKSIDYDLLRKQWRTSGVDTVFFYTENRFVGIGQGLQRNHFDLIGCWVDVERQLTFTPTSMRIQKRKDSGVDYTSSTSHQIIQLAPPVNVGASEPYKMKTRWLETDEDKEQQDDLDQTR